MTEQQRDLLYAVAESVYGFLWGNDLCEEALELLDCIANARESERLGAQPSEGDDYGE